ncbi:AMP-binding protein [Lentzea nigeriaca]|uniref:AMP-binding protein n=1 Tax=Lentzea nigeriaca TaxID=1128665 RepID=UPI001957795C|nr:AMP-binding protein [Lentzea nigeriaca]MBM7863240.1 acyl-coenzyme A synthetase/AMP-(fatty) acid ligase [Lentzea nigeriaca]
MNNLHTPAPHHPAAHRPTARSRNAALTLARHADRAGWSSRPAYLIGDEVWRHGQIHDLAARAAKVLHDRGIRPDDHVLLAAPDGPAWVVAFLAIARLGAVAVLANPELTAADHHLLLADCDASACVTDAALEERFPNWIDVDHLLDQAWTTAPGPAADVAPTSPLYVQYTSGTTGQPKGVVHAHKDLALYGTSVGRDVLRIGIGDVALSVSKMFWAYGFGNALVFPLHSGSSAVLTPHRPCAEEIAELTVRHRVNLLYSVPSSYAALASTKLTSLRAAVSAGEPMPEPLGALLRDELGIEVLDQIGSTEAGHAFCANGIGDNTPGTLGRPVPGWEVQVRDEQGFPVDEGELWVRGPTLFSHYLNQPGLTGSTLVDGWLTTHDRVRQNHDGTLSHLGRTDDMEMVGGISLSPLEIERVLAAHPLVREAAVAAVLDQHDASRLRAFVVPAQDTPGLEDELITWTRSRLPSFKVPRTVRLVPQLPRTATGKLRRHVVRTGSW